MFRVLFCLLLVLVLFAPGQEQTSTVAPLWILMLNSDEESARLRAGVDIRGVDGGNAEVAHLAETIPAANRHRAEAQHRHAQSRRSETTLLHLRLLTSATRLDLLIAAV